VSTRQALAKYYTSFNIPGAYENYGTPRDMVTLPDGNMWYADSTNSRIVKIDPTGAILRTVGRSGTDEGEFANTLTSITVDPKDIYMFLIIVKFIN